MGLPSGSSIIAISTPGRTVVRASWGIYFDSYSQDYFVGQLPFNTFNAGPAFNGIGPSPILLSQNRAGNWQNDVARFSQSDVPSRWAQGW